MGTATQTLIVIIQNLVAKVGDDDGKLAAALTEVQTAEAAEETEIQALKTQVAALPAPYDPTALEARVTALEAIGGSQAVEELAPALQRIQALEDRNTADDQAAGAVAGIVSEDPPTSGAGATMALGSDPLPALTVGIPYIAQVGASGGVAPYQFSIAAGAPPDGLSLGAGGQLSGVPTAAGSSDVTIQAHDANGTAAQEAYTLVVSDPVADPVEAEPTSGADPAPQ